MLEDQPTFADVAGNVAELMHGRTLVAHNAALRLLIPDRRGWNWPAPSFRSTA